jgi:hypothetical protein
MPLQVLESEGVSNWRVDDSEKFDSSRYGGGWLNYWLILDRCRCKGQNSIKGDASQSRPTRRVVAVVAYSTRGKGKVRTDGSRWCAWSNPVLPGCPTKRGIHHERWRLQGDRQVNAVEARHPIRTHSFSEATDSQSRKNGAWDVALCRPGGPCSQQRRWLEDIYEILHGTTPAKRTGSRSRCGTRREGRFGPLSLGGRDR